MHSTGRLCCTALLLVFAFQEILFSTSVTALDNSASSNFGITCLPKPPLPLTFITALDEIFLLNRTLSSIEVSVITRTIGQLTGGIFGSDIYKFEKFVLHWVTPTFDYCSENYNNENFLMARVIYCNVKYTNIEASNHPDGILNVLVPVAANAPIDNPLFSPFEKIFKENLTKPGIIAIPSAITYTWFDHFGPSSTYKIYKGTFNDPATGKTYSCATIVELPSAQFTNFISCRQYFRTFGSIKDALGNPLNNPLPEIIPLTSPESQCGITVLNLKFI